MCIKTGLPPTKYNIFAVSELPKAFNDFYSKIFLQKSLLPYAKITFRLPDLAAAYDQIPLPPSIQKYVCFFIPGISVSGSEAPDGNQAGRGSG